MHAYTVLQHNTLCCTDTLVKHVALSEPAAIAFATELVAALRAEHAAEEYEDDADMWIPDVVWSRSILLDEDSGEDFVSVVVQRFPLQTH